MTENSPSARCDVAGDGAKKMLLKNAICRTESPVCNTPFPHILPSDINHKMLFLRSIISLLSFIYCVSGSSVTSYKQQPVTRAHGKTCIVKAGGSNTTDDAPAIRKAFRECGHGGTVAFKNTTYFVNTVMDIRGLKDCTIDLKGTLLVWPICSC